MSSSTTCGEAAKCSCETTTTTTTHESDSESSPPPKEPKKNKISLTSLSLNLRRGRSLPLKGKRNKKSSGNCLGETGESSEAGGGGVKKSSKWPWGVAEKFYYGKKEAPRTSPVVPDEKRERQEKQTYCSCIKKVEEEPQTPQPPAVCAPIPEVMVVAALAVPEEEDIYVPAAPLNAYVETAPEREQQPEAPVVEAEEEEAPLPTPPPAEEENPQEVNNNAADEIINPPVPAVVFNTVDASVYAAARAERENARRLPHIFVAPNLQSGDVQWRPMGQEDVDEEARLQRAREIERGVDPPPSFRPTRRVQLFCPDENESHAVRRVQIFCPNDVTVDSLRAIFQNNVTLRTCPLDVIAGCHTQVDFIHCLVPDLMNITNCSFYWGKMDRYEAERLLDGKREGTFLLRDSAQEEFLFSVSFRKYGRSLHARIEQWNHRFSFDSHDPGVYTSNTVCGLIEHYKDPSSCMFFEPMLTWPLHRNFVFSLQHLCRASIVTRLTYDDVNHLQLPKSLKTYLKEYHYRQKVRVERFDDDVQWLEVRNSPS